MFFLHATGYDVPAIPIAVFSRKGIACIRGSFMMAVYDFNVLQGIHLEVRRFVGGRRHMRHIAIVIPSHGKRAIVHKAIYSVAFKGKVKIIGAGGVRWLPFCGIDEISLW